MFTFTAMILPASFVPTRLVSAGKLFVFGGIGGPEHCILLDTGLGGAFGILHYSSNV